MDTEFGLDVGAPSLERPKSPEEMGGTIFGKAPSGMEGLGRTPDGKFFLISYTATARDGEVLSPPIDSISPELANDMGLENAAWSFEKNGRCRLYDTQLELITDEEFLYAYPVSSSESSLFSKNVFKVKRLDGKFYFYDVSEKKYVEEEGFEKIVVDFETSDRLVCQRSDGFYILDTDFKNVVSEGFKEVRASSEGKFIVQRSDGTWEALDTSGKFITDGKYEAMSSFNEGIAAVKKDGLWQFINNEGTVTSDEQFQDVQLLYEKSFFDGTASVKKEDGLSHLVDKTGKEIFKRGYDGIFPSQRGLVVLREGALCYLFDKDENNLLAPYPNLRFSSIGVGQSQNDVLYLTTEDDPELQLESGSGFRPYEICMYLAKGDLVSYAKERLAKFSESVVMRKEKRLRTLRLQGKIT